MFDHKLINSIQNLLLKRKETIAVAESVTSGLLQFAFSNAENAAKFYQGGLTAYNLGQKCRHLHIEPIHAFSCNCVSDQTASEMATGIADLFKSDWGLGITGYATPVPESENKIFAFYAISYKAKILNTQIISPGKMDFLKVQLFYVHKLLDSLNDLLASV
ncbi:MAG TPA: CinA family protein [Chitinophagaceae bacterium]